MAEGQALRRHGNHATANGRGSGANSCLAGLAQADVVGGDGRPLSVHSVPAVSSASRCRVAILGFGTVVGTVVGTAGTIRSAVARRLSAPDAIVALPNGTTSAVPSRSRFQQSGFQPFDCVLAEAV